MQLGSIWVYYSGIFLPILCCECTIYEQWECLARPADLERTEGVQDVSVLWDAASHMARASRSGFKVIKWVAVPTGMAQSSLQGLLANSMSTIDFLSHGLRVKVLPCVTARWNPAGAHCCWDISQHQRQPGIVWKGVGPCQPWTYFPHSSQMFFWSSPDFCSCSKIPPEPLEENKSQGKASNGDTNYVRIQTSPNLTFFKVKCRTCRLLIAFGL